MWTSVKVATLVPAGLQLLASKFVLQVLQLLAIFILITGRYNLTLPTQATTSNGEMGFNELHLSRVRLVKSRPDLNLTGDQY